MSRKNTKGVKGIEPAGPLGRVDGTTTGLLDGTIRTGTTLLAPEGSTAAEEDNADVFDLTGASKAKAHLDDQIDIKTSVPP